MARVALIGENSAEYIETLLDIWNNGDCAVLLDWRIPYQTIIEMMKEARVGKCYIEKQQLDKGFDTLSEEIMFIPFEKNNNYAKYLPNEIYRKFNSNYSSDEAIILYSSGTTGKSKGIILSHYAINTNADAIIDYMKPSADDCIYIAKTLSHSSTLTGELLVALKTHAKLVVAPTIVPPRYILNKINELRVSIICLNPTLLSMFADEYQRSNHKISSLRTIYVSGSILNDKIYAKAQKVFPNITIYNVYGLTEAGPRVTAQRVDCCASNSVGKPIKGVAIAIVDEHGSPVVKGKHGIIHVNTQSQLSGYVSGENKQPSLFKSWLNTGDYGKVQK